VNTGKGKEAVTAIETEPATPLEPVVVPSETVFMQIVDFLLDAKAMPVKASHILIVLQTLANRVAQPLAYVSWVQ